jgi:DNA-damage-inducible protein D
MKSELIYSLTGDFESFSHKTPEGVEFWLACDLQHLLGYKEWRNFLAVLNKAQTACEVSGNAISDHFVEVNKMVGIGSNTNREMQDFLSQVE